MKDRTAAKNRAKTLTLSLLRKHNAQRLDQIERQIQAIETAILAAIEADADLASRFAILTSIPGVSAVTAFALLIAMPELGALDAGQAASFDPMFPCHTIMHGSNKFGLASLVNLDQLPPTGAVLIAPPLKIVNGSGSPLRVLALVPA